MVNAGQRIFPQRITILYISGKAKRATFARKVALFGIRLYARSERGPERSYYRLAIFCAMYRSSLRSSSSALLNKRRSLLR